MTFMAVAGAHKACPNVAIMMIKSSMPSVHDDEEVKHMVVVDYLQMRFRPRTSPNHPNSSWPRSTPTGVAILMPRSSAVLRELLESIEMSSSK